MERIVSSCRRAILLTLTMGLWGCVAPVANEDGQLAGDVEALVPSRGAANTFDVASWNLEWFGASSNGPTDDALQRENAYDVILGAEMDIWGLVEMVSNTQFNALRSSLTGYSGFLANDSIVVNGSSYYTSSEQKLGILYRSSVASLIDARIILTSYDSYFAGRPPLQARFNVTINGTTEEVVIIVVHAKCCTDSTSWSRRQTAANALKSYLDSSFPTQRVWVVGDFNDDIDRSISSGRTSPYASFVTDSADYRFATAPLTSAGVSSTVGYSDMIDHHLVTNEAYARYIANSVEVYRVDSDVMNYASTTSDHYPVLSRYSWPSSSGGSGGGGSGGGTPAQLILNEICANEPGSNTAGEFIEILNVGGSAADLGGYTISDSVSTRHRFAAGTQLAAGKAFVVYGNQSGVPSGMSNAVGASTGALGLNNGGDTVRLATSSGATVQSFSYSSSLASSDGVSMNRSRDGDGASSFVSHFSISSYSRSPGARVSGSAW